MSKRKFEDLPFELEDEKVSKRHDNFNKNSLDSDEEDNKDEDAYALEEDDIEGAEEGENRMEGEVRLTAFNMKEEMEEGHFDKDGHFLWKKEKQIQDNWLDSIDWQKIRKPTEADLQKVKKSLGDESSDSEDEHFNEIETYKKLLKLMKPKETVAKALKRLGGQNKKLSSQERWKLKKLGQLNENNNQVNEITELANQILTQKGNMDIYQETYEMITNKINKFDQKQVKKDVEFDMYADDFSEKEKIKLEVTPSSSKSEDVKETRSEFDELMWEFKWSQDSGEIKGPYTSKQMQKWVEEGYFKNGAWARKVGQDSSFYTINRIDFDLYI